MPRSFPAKAAQADLFALPSEVFGAGRAMARAFADSLHGEGDRLTVARVACIRVVEEYWARLGGRTGLREDGVVAEAELPSSILALASDFGSAASSLEPERAFYEIGRLYNAMLPQTWRARFGVYYTPPELVERLIDRATDSGLDWRNCRVLDPACGGGAFLAPVARRMLVELDGCEPLMVLRNIGSRLRGLEIDPFAAWLSQVALDAVLSATADLAGRRLASVVTVCNSLDPATETGNYDLVIGNPPYGRIKLDSAARAHFKRSLYGHANLYGLFTDLALRHTAPNGFVAYVTPTSFLAGNYFKNLRALLAREAPPITLDFVDARKGVFDDVLQETLLAVYRKDARPRIAESHLLSIDKGGELRAAAAGKFELPSDASQPWLVPRSPQQALTLRTAATFGSRLRDWGYTVSTGPLVWNRHKPQLTRSRGRNCFPLIWAESVTPRGEFEFKATKRNHTPYFAVRPGDEWLVVTKACVLVQRTTAKEQERRLIAAQMQNAFLAAFGGVVVENHLNMLLPVDEAPRVSPAVLTAFLNARATDYVFRCLSGSVAVSAYELEALPLPPVEAVSELARLVEEGAGRDFIEAECARLYGMDGS